MKSCRINTQDRHLIVDTDGARILVPCQCKATDVLTFGDWDEFACSGTRGWRAVLALEGTGNRLVDLNTLPDGRPLICEKLHGSQSVYCNDEGMFAFFAC